MEAESGGIKTKCVHSHMIKQHTVLVLSLRVLSLLTRHSGTSASCLQCSAYQPQSEFQTSRCRCRRSGRPGSCDTVSPPPPGEPDGCSDSVGD